MEIEARPSELAAAKDMADATAIRRQYGKPLRSELKAIMVGRLIVLAILPGRRFASAAVRV